MTPESKETEPSKKSRHRSPNYPALGLREAVAKIAAIYQQDKLAAAPRNAALKAMGFEKAHGEASRVLSALKAFGLIEEADGRIKLTQRGIDIVVRTEGEQQRASALQEAAIGPEIYRELLKQYRESGLPSDTSLASELKAVKKFNPNAVEGFIRDFRDTLELAGLSDIGVINWELEAETVAPEPETKPPLKGRVAPPPPSRFPITPPPLLRERNEGQKMQQDVFTLTEGPVTIQWPGSLSPESYEDLGDWLDIMKRKIGRSIKDRRQAQKDRIAQTVREIHPGAIIKFEDHGPFIWFRVTSSGGTTLVQYSEDRDAEFYERLSDEELGQRLQALSNQKL